MFALQMTLHLQGPEDLLIGKAESISTVAKMVQYIVNPGLYSTSESAALAGIHVC